MTTSLYPLLFAPVYKDYLWGGKSLASVYNRPETPEICAESWEIADRPEGMSIVSNGSLKGTTLHELMELYPIELAGTSSEQAEFPLLIKIIDAKRRLSVQVHPNNANAEICGGESKTEMWYILDSKPGSQIMAGFATDTDENSLLKAVKDNTLSDIISSTPVEKGQAIYIPGGRVHAIGEGCLILEIQQNSNTTYRVYDWDRVGPDGKPRDLHIEQALKAIDWDDAQLPVIEPTLIKKQEGNSFWTILESPFFTVERLDLSTAEKMTNDGKSFHALFIASGEAVISGNDVTETCMAGSSILIPAALNEYDITPSGESVEIILTKTC